MISAKVASYSIVCNLAVALVSPLLFVLFGSGVSASALAWSLFHRDACCALDSVPAYGRLFALSLLSSVHTAVGKIQGISFYLWSVSLIVVVGRAVSFVLAEPARGCTVDDCRECAGAVCVSGSVRCRAYYRTAIR